MAQPHIVLQGTGHSWESDRRLGIGRMPSCEVILDDASVSRRHAEVFYSEAGWLVRDLGSTNGTFLNGTRLGRNAQRLQRGDQLQPGKFVLRVHALVDESTASAGELEGPTVLEPASQFGSAASAARMGISAQLAPGQGLGATLLTEDAHLLLDSQRAAFLHTLAALAQAVDARDPFTVGHAQRVTDYVLLLAEAVEVAPLDYHHLQIATPLHDIGKIGIADAILRKPGRLTAAEFAEIRSHPLKGAMLLEAIPGFAAALPIVRSHHEHWDGTGYPDGLIGEAISPLARMVTVADVFDALTSDRPYRRALNVTEACQYLEKNTGTLFDPAHAQAFLNLRPRLEQMVHARLAACPTLNKVELDRLRGSLQGSGSPPAGAAGLIT